jgi:hypothetical protein
VQELELAAAGAGEVQELVLAAADGEVALLELAAAGAGEVQELELAAAGADEVALLELAAAGAGEVPALELAAADGEVPALELAAAGGEVPALEVAAAGAGEAPALELAAAGGEAAEDEDVVWVAGKRQRVCVGEVHPEPATEEPLDAAIARGEVICSPCSAAWARARLALEDGEVDPVVHQAPLQRPLSEAERARQGRLVQYTLFGTPAPGAVPAPCSPHPSIWDAPGEDMSVAEEGEEEEPDDDATDAEPIDPEGAQDVQAEFDALFANARPPSPGADFNAALDQLEEDLRSPEDEVGENALDDPYGAAEPQECDMYAALAGALSDEENLETPAHGEEHRVGFDWVNRYRAEDASEYDPQVWVGGIHARPRRRGYIGYIRYVPLAWGSLEGRGM